MTARRLLAFVPILLWLSPAHAIDLVSSWQAARAYDPGFFAARNALTAGQEYSNQGDAAMLPQVSMSGYVDRTRTDYRPGPSDTPAKLSQGQQYGVNVSLAQPIYDAGARAKRDEFKQLSLQAEVHYRIAEQDLVLRVAKAYFELLLARENVKLVAAQKGAIALQLAIAKKQFRLGAATVTDTNDAQARYDAVLAGEIAVTNDLEVKSSSYRRLTSLDPVLLVPISEPFLAPDPQPELMASWLSQAAESNLAVKAQQLGLDLAAATIGRYRLESAPTLSLVAAYGSQVESRGISSSGGRDQTLSGSIGVQISIPLYSGGSRSSLLRQAVALRDQQRDVLEAVRLDAQETTRQAFLGVKGGAAQIRALEQARISSASSLASSKRGREVGVRTTLDVLNAEQNYYQTLYSLVAARYQYLISRLQLVASVGQLNEQELVKVNADMLGRERFGGHATRD